MASSAMLTRVLRSSGMTSLSGCAARRSGSSASAHHDRRGARVRVDVRGQAALPGGGHQRPRAAVAGVPAQHRVDTPRAAGAACSRGSTPPRAIRPSRHLQTPRVIASDRPDVTRTLLRQYDRALGATSRQRRTSLASCHQADEPTVAREVVVTTDAVLDAPRPVTGARARTGTVTPLPRRTARLLIVDDEAIVRFGLRQLFAADPQLVVIGEAATPRDALVIADRCPPDLVVLDVELGRGDARRRRPRPPAARAPPRRPGPGAHRLPRPRADDAHRAPRRARLPAQERRHRRHRRAPCTPCCAARACSTRLRARSLVDVLRDEPPDRPAAGARCSPSGRTRCCGCSRWACPTGRSAAGW